MFPRPWLSHPQVGGSRHLLRTPTAPRHTRAPPVPEGSGRRRGAVRSAFSPAGALHLQAANPGRHLFKQKRGPRAPPVQRTRGASRLCPEQDAPALVAPLGVRGPRVGTPAARSARCPPPREPHPPRRRWPPGGRPAGSGAAPTPWRCAADPRPARARGGRACAGRACVRAPGERPSGTAAAWGRGQGRAGRMRRPPARPPPPPRSGSGTLFLTAVGGSDPYSRPSASWHRRACGGL